MNEYPFIFGAQYYRSPSPEKECWSDDLKHMKDLGFNSVKYWVQWRWAHRGPDEFYFEDIDELMDLAYEYGLEVTLNIIFDVSPTWLYGKYPDAYQVSSSGEKILPTTHASRQIGGVSGPCYNHMGAYQERMKFLNTTVKRYRNHKALSMWDVWNEPEHSVIYREPKFSDLLCYCQHCRAGFVDWLQNKYGCLDEVNKIWSRCYNSWDEVEMPYSGSTLVDFIDYREYSLDKMTREANSRIEAVKKQDKSHLVYLHVVPNTMRIFNSVTCVDDYALAENCDVFAATLFAGPRWGYQTTSAARGKITYNVESHIGNGSIIMHPKIITLNDLLKDFLPQIGLGIKGFMFWQFRPEILGTEAPAWGVIKLNGQDGPISRAAKTFWAKLKPHTKPIMEAVQEQANIAVWVSRKNELFNFAAYESLTHIADSIEAYVDALYWENYSFSLIDSNILEKGELDGIKLLILPTPYCLTEQEAASVDRFVKNGGVVLSEAHLGAYNLTGGRHSRIVPGCGLSEAWGIQEVETTSSYHLTVKEKQEASREGLATDVKKALDVYGSTGGKFFPIERENGSILYGAERYAELHGEDAQRSGTFGGKTSMLSKQIGKGQIIYAGSNIGQGAERDAALFADFIKDVCSTAGIVPNFDSMKQSIHIDALGDDILVIQNRSKECRTLRALSDKSLKGLYSGIVIDEGQDTELPGDFVDIFINM